MPNVPIPSPWIDSWNPQINLDTPTGRIIRELVGLVPEDTRITLFGSAALQISVDSEFLSEAVDCFGPPDLKKLVTDHELSKSSLKSYVRVWHDLNFQTSLHWLTRAYTFPLEGRIIVIPHPIDILIAKLNCLEEKDLKAFELVYEKTGHPTEEEMIDALQSAVDLFRPGFDEEETVDMKVTTQILWRAFFGNDIDVTEKIIRPTLLRREEGFAPDNPTIDYKAMLESE